MFSSFLFSASVWSFSIIWFCSQTILSLSPLCSFSLLNLNFISHIYFLFETKIAWFPDSPIANEFTVINHLHLHMCMCFSFLFIRSVPWTYTSCDGNLDTILFSFLRSAGTNFSGRKCSTSFYSLRSSFFAKFLCAEKRRDTRKFTLTHSVYFHTNLPSVWTTCSWNVCCSFFFRRVLWHKPKAGSQQRQQQQQPVKKSTSKSHEHCTRSNT